LKLAIADFDNPEYEIDEEKYLLSKEILSQIKDIQVSCKKFGLSRRLIQIVAENVSLAYKLEKLSRMKFYSTQPKQETTEYAKGISSKALAFAGKNL
jgi:hypothetical protein